MKFSQRLFTSNSSALKESLPILVTSLVNKSGSIGLSLLPILIIERGYTSNQGTLAMTLVKASVLIATLASGVFSDKFGLRNTLLVSLIFAGVGLGLLPIPLGFLAFVFLGMIAQFGITSINTSMRLILTQTVQLKNQREALAWMKLVNNLGQVFSFGLASVASQFGTSLLIWFDSATTWAALALGIKALPQKSKQTKQSTTTATPSYHSPFGYGPFLSATLLSLVWNFSYDYFIGGVAGRLKIAYPDTGIKLFSNMMVFNTILCALLSVYLTKKMDNVQNSLKMGMGLILLGVFFGVATSPTKLNLFFGILFLTGGEITYSSFGQFLMIRAVPKTAKPNSLYATAVLFASFGKIAASSLVFPLIIHSKSPWPSRWVVLFLTLVSFIALKSHKKEFKQLTK